MGKKILVVDDEAATSETLSQMLAALGYAVTCVASGSEAITLLQSGAFNLCFTTLGTPAVGKFAILEAAQNCQPMVPVIVLAKPGNVRDAIAGLRAGALDFLAKPFHPVAVETALKRFLDSTQPMTGWR